MTKQQIVEKILLHIHEHGRSFRRLRGTTICAYRGDLGAKCAAGILILDEFYSEEFEGQMSEASQLREALINSGVKPHQLKMVGKLQTCHDSPSHDSPKTEAEAREAVINRILEYSKRKSIRVSRAVKDKVLNRNSKPNSEMTDV